LAFIIFQHLICYFKFQTVLYNYIYITVACFCWRAEHREKIELMFIYIYIYINCFCHRIKCMMLWICWFISLCRLMYTTTRTSFWHIPCSTALVSLHVHAWCMPLPSPATVCIHASFLRCFLISFPFPWHAYIYLEFLIH
jgi:hypothetical protein